MSNTPDPQPGWYPDPAGPTWSLRYWDGTQWTDKTTPRPTSPAPGDGAAPTQAVPGPEGAVQAPQRSEPQQSEPQRSEPQQSERPYDEPRYDEPQYRADLGATSAMTAYPEGAEQAPVFPDGPHPGPNWAVRRRFGRRPPRAVLVVLGSILVPLAVYGVAVGVYSLVHAAPRHDRGTAWFAGGVPGWDNVSLSGWSDTDGQLLQAWLVPGPQFGPDHPFLAVARISGSLPHGQSASVVLQAERVALEGSASVNDLHLVDLNDGAPGLLWSNSDHLAAAPTIPLTDYSLFALRGRYLYGVFFETTTAAFPAERSEVQPVMLSFRGVSTSAGTAGPET